jgi:hypothetical protein
MAPPPRVSAFGPAKRRARNIQTDWGVLPVVHPVDLVEIKRTLRFADFDIITDLVLLYLAENPELDEAVLRWAAQNCFRPRSARPFWRVYADPQTVNLCAKRISKEVADLQASDRAYWFDDLRIMRREGKLLLNLLRSADRKRIPTIDCWNQAEPSFSIKNRRSQPDSFIS